MSCPIKNTAQCLNKDCYPAIEEKCTYKYKRMTDEEFQAKQAELLKNIPEELKAALSYMAYESGHAYGNEEIISHLKDYVSNLEEPLKNLIKRLTS